MIIGLALALSFMFGAQKIDINNANVNELSTLKGIGAKKAEAIIKYREDNGCFLKRSDLSGVKGIGDKTVEKNKEIIIVGKCKEKKSYSKNLKDLSQKNKKKDTKSKKEDKK